MRFPSGQKQLPYLTEYLTQAAVFKPSNRQIGLGLMVSAGTLACAGVAFLVANNSFSNFLLFGLGLVLTGMAAPVMGIGISYMQKGRSSKPDEERRLLDQARIVAHKYLEVANQNRLHRSLHPAVGDLLECAARDWKRAKDAIDNEFWKSESLPDHWKAARDRARSNADRAMAELMLLMEGELKAKEHVPWQESLVTVLESIGIDTGAPNPNEDDYLPVEFEAGRNVAQNLKKLADELEKSTQEVLNSSDLRGRLNATRSIEESLGELRSIREAEAELRQNS